MFNHPTPCGSWGASERSNTPRSCTTGCLHWTKKKKKNHVLFCPHIIKHISTTTQHQVKKKIKTTFKSFHCHRLPSIQTKDKGPTEQGACWPVQVHSAQNEVLDSLKKQLQTVLRREGCPGCTVLGGYSVVHGSHTALRVRTLAFIYPGIFCLAPSCLWEILTVLRALWIHLC